MTPDTSPTDGSRHSSAPRRGRASTARRDRTGFVAVAAALLCGQALSIPSSFAITVVEPTYLPAGVSDFAGTLGCLRSPEGGVDAVDLKSGRSLWRSDARARPLLVTGGRAFLLEESAKQPLRLVVRTAQDGRQVRAYDLASLALPPWASLSEQREARQWTEFEAAARLMGDRLEIHYIVTRRQVSGMAGPGAAAQVEGVALVALDSGRIAGQIGPPSPPPLVSEPAPPMAGVRFVALHARPADARIVLGGPPANAGTALIAGERRMAFELSRDAKTVLVHRWSYAGGSREPVLRLEHGQPTDAVWVTLDRRHVLLRRASDQRFYDLYSLDSAKSEGKLEAPVDVAVVGQRVYWTTRESKGRLVLAASNLEAGRKLWRHTVRRAEGPPGEPIP